MNSLHLLSAIMPAHAAIALHLKRDQPAATPSNEMPGLHAELILAKYIIIEQAGREYVLVFSRDLQHSEMLTPRAGRPVSAGFVQFITPDHVVASGESTTLNLHARPQDSSIIKHQILSVLSVPSVL